MRIAVASDLHLEFGEITLENKNNIDVLILSGDILVASDITSQDVLSAGKTERYRQFFEDCSKNFPHVLYVMGNHEHYHGDFAKTASVLRDFLEPFYNVQLLDKEYTVLNGFVFYGGTLWTDFDMGYGPCEGSAMREVGSRMNDYRCVKNSSANRRFSPEDSYKDHIEYLHELMLALDTHKDKSFIVIGHHAPSKQSTHPRYIKEVLMNTGYSSDLTGFIFENYQIRVWTHGHMHDNFAYNVGRCSIICNPRGYDGYEPNADNFRLRYFDIDELGNKVLDDVLTD